MQSDAEDIQMSDRSEANAFRKPELRRQQLLEAAYSVLTEKGPSKATVSDITERANTSKGTFYLYFESKEHAVAALWSEFVDQFVHRTKELLQELPALGWWGVVDRLVTDLIDYDAEHSGMHRIVAMSAREEAMERFAEADRRVIDLLSGFISEGVSAGAFRASDPHLAAAFLYHGADQILQTAALTGQPLDTNRVIRTAREIIHKALAP